MDKINHYAELAAVDVRQYVEKKNGLSYLSWAYAIDQLMRKDPDANFTFNEPTRYGETLMVSATVTAFGKSITMPLPVMDHKNQAIKNPDAFQINKNQMRALVKAIACHGLGINLYAGEDLPMEECASVQPVKQGPINELQIDEINELLDATNSDKARFCAHYKISSIPELPAAYYQQAIHALQSKLKKAA